MPAIRDGDHILVIDRKLFHDDNTRFFVGVVEEYDDPFSQREARDA